MDVVTKLSNPEFWQRKCLDDLYFLCRTVLITLEDTSNGYKDLYYPTHKRICDFVQNYAKPGQKLLVLTPRGWVKSYIITVGWYIQRLLNNLTAGRREIGLIANATYPNAAEFLRRIKHNLQYNDFLRFLFSSYLPHDLENQATEWTKDAIEISGNRIELGAVEKNLVSKHFFLMILDDLVNRDNSLTALGLSQVHDWWGLAHSLLHPQGIEINIGTRWGTDDNYGMIMGKFCKPPGNEIYNQPIAEWHNGNYHVLHINCWEDPQTETGSTFPVLFPEEKLKELQKQLGDRFPGQYENNPLNTARNPFKRQWLKRWTREGLPDIRYTLMLVDPSGKAKQEESSATGIDICHLCPDKKIYIEYADSLMITDKLLAEKMVDLSMIYRPDNIIIEDVKYFTLIDLLELVIEQRLHREALSITKEDAEYMKIIPRICLEGKPRGRPKPVRIKQLTGFFEQGHILLPFNGAEALENEYERYPAVKNDVLDALAYVLDFATFPRPDDTPKMFLVPDKLKMTQEERIEDEWEHMRQEAFSDGTYSDETDGAWLEEK